MTCGASGSSVGRGQSDALVKCLAALGKIGGSPLIENQREAASGELHMQLIRTCTPRGDLQLRRIRNWTPGGAAPRAVTMPPAPTPCSHPGRPLGGAETGEAPDGVGGDAR